MSLTHSNYLYICTLHHTFLLLLLLLMLLLMVVVYKSIEHFVLLSLLFVSATSFDIVADPSTKTLRLELDILVDLNDYVETRREL